MTKLSLDQQIAVTAHAIRDALEVEDFSEQVLVVLGSGFKSFAEAVRVEQEVHFSEIPHLPQPRVYGHGGSIIQGRVNDRSVILCTGRIHLYEGYSADEVVHCVRSFERLGVRRLLLTNAAGSVDPDYKPGEVMALRDHINFTGRNCLIGEAADLGKQFVDMVNAYDSDWRERIVTKATIKSGVYLGALGPSYETPAETRMMGQLGANCVGMSTVLETIAGRQLGMSVAALSLITNFAGGLADKVDHEEVLQLGREVGPRLTEVLATAIQCADATPITRGV